MVRAEALEGFAPEDDRGGLKGLVFDVLETRSGGILDIRNACDMSVNTL